MKLRFNPSVLAMVCLLWGAAVTAGTVLMWNYAQQPGRTGNTASAWPAESRIMRSGKLPTLVMFCHPQCPCTRASLGELSRLLADIHGQVEAQVLFFKPAGLPDDWARTDLWRSAEEVPGVRVQIDEDASEARRFQVETSGHALLYDTRGRLLFSGGLTAARGHEGDNAGCDALAALLRGTTAAEGRTPVFGCSLLAPESTCQIAAPESTPLRHQ
jgi:hypothetical protein